MPALTMRATTPIARATRPSAARAIASGMAIPRAGNNKAGAARRLVASAVPNAKRPGLPAERAIPAPLVTEQAPATPASKKVAQAAFTAALVAALANATLAPGALAAGSGGRVGGSGGFAAARSAPSMSSRSYGGGGGGARYESRTAPPLRVAPRSLNGVGLGWGLVPFGGYGFGGYGGYGYPAPVVVGGGGGSNLFIIGLFAFVALTIVSSFVNNRADEGDDAGAGAGGGRVTVAKLQVGLLGSARSLQRDLDRIAGKADTSTPGGLHFVLQETVLALLRNPEYAVYGAATTKSKRSLSAGEAAFNEASLDERGKLAEETLVNVGGRSRAGVFSKGGSGAGGGSAGDDELVVVTLLVAARGGLSLPKVTSGPELKAALNRLGSVPSEDVLAVEVLWTPQDPKDKYFRSDAVADYPELNVL